MQNVFLTSLTTPEVRELFREELANFFPSLPSQNEDYKPLQKAAEFLGKTPNAIRVMVCKNQIKHIKKGGKLYFKSSDLIDYLESGRVEKEPINAVDVLSKKKGV